jgi:hypothetical protein
MWAGKESVLSLDGETFTLIVWTVKLVLGDLALAFIYGLFTVFRANRIAPPCKICDRTHPYLFRTTPNFTINCQRLNTIATSQKIINRPGANG